jgi:hypothetical protein
VTKISTAPGTGLQIRLNDCTWDADHCCYAWNTLIDQPWKIMSRYATGPPSVIHCEDWYKPVRQPIETIALLIEQH